MRQRLQTERRQLTLSSLQRDFIRFLRGIRAASENGTVFQRIHLCPTRGGDGAGLQHIPARVNPMALFLVPRRLFPAQRIVLLVEQAAAILFERGNLIRQLCP